VRGSGYWGWGCLGEADGRAMFLRPGDSFVYSRNVQMVCRMSLTCNIPHPQAFL